MDLSESFIREMLDKSMDSIPPPGKIEEKRFCLTNQQWRACVRFHTDPRWFCFKDDQFTGILYDKDKVISWLNLCA